MDTPVSERTHVEYGPASSGAHGSFSKEDITKEDVCKEEARTPPPSACGDDPDPVEDFYPDGGRGWLVVLGCVIFCAATVGWGLAWGVIQDYYQAHLFPDASDTLLSTLGSMSGMIMTLASIVFGKLGDRYGYRYFLAAGAICWVVSMLASAFCTELWQFFLTQGILQGIASALVFPLIVALPAQWFFKYRALTTGMVVAGSSLGGAISSLLLRAMLEPLGYKKTFIIISGIDAFCLIIAFFLIKERRPPGSKRRQIIWFDVTFFKDPVFWSLGFCFLFTTFGYLSPIFYLPSFTAEKLPHLSSFLAELPLTILNLSAAAGRTGVGFIADRIGPVNALFIAVLMSGLTQLLIWTFVADYAGIMSFAVLYGFFCGCFLSLSPAVAARLYGSGRLAGLSGLLLMFNLPGNSTGAPIGGAILTASGGSWKAVSIYSGCTQIVGATILLYARFKREHKVMAAF